MTMIDLLSVGSWASIDYIYKMSHFPEEGETIVIESEDDKDKGYFGDCSINLAYVAAKLGISTSLATIVGKDFDDIGYRSHLEKAGIDLTGLSIKDNQLCGRNYLFFDENGQGFCFSRLGASKNQEDERVPEEVISKARNVVISENFSQYTLEALKSAKANGARTFTNGMLETAGDLLEEFLFHTDVMFINESEFTRLIIEIGGDKATLFTKYDVKTIFLTKGKSGCEIIELSNVKEVKAVIIDNVVDTTGAGDSFAGGTIASLIKGYSPEEAAQFGSTVSSFIIEQWGCQTNAPSWEQVNERFKEYFAYSL